MVPSTGGDEGTPSTDCQSTFLPFHLPTTRSPHDPKVAPYDQLASAYPATQILSPSTATEVYSPIRPGSRLWHFGGVHSSPDVAAACVSPPHEQPAHENATLRVASAVSARSARPSPDFAAVDLDFGATASASPRRSAGDDAATAIARSHAAPRGALLEPTATSQPQPAAVPSPRPRRSACWAVPMLPSSSFASTSRKCAAPVAIVCIAVAVCQSDHAPTSSRVRTIA